MSGRSVWDLQGEPNASCCKSHTDQMRILHRTFRQIMHLNTVTMLTNYFRWYELF